MSCCCPILNGTMTDTGDNSTSSSIWQSTGHEVRQGTIQSVGLVLYSFQRRVASSLSECGCNNRKYCYKYGQQPVINIEQWKHRDSWLYCKVIQQQLLAWPLLGLGPCHKSSKLDWKQQCNSHLPVPSAVNSSKPRTSGKVGRKGQVFSACNKIV